MTATIEDIYQQAMDHFWETFPPVWNAVRSHVRSIAQEQFGITVEQFHVLRHIRRNVDSISALAALGRISRPAISQGVDALVHKGLVTRQQSNRDRRYVKLELTTQGNALLDAVFASNREWMKTRLAALSSLELETINSGLTALKKALE